MSDSTQGSPSPRPKPKPGSLRDRIAAFERPAQGNEPVPPPPRPKPSGIQWRQKVHQQEESSGGMMGNGSGGGLGAGMGSGAAAAAEGVVGGASNAANSMSASDARDSIRQGASLKERMAALQGKGAFGGGPTSPPAQQPQPVQRPKWKPPPQPQAVGVSTISEGEEGREGKKEEETKESDDAAAQGVKSAATTGVEEGELEESASHPAESGKERAKQEQGQEQEQQPDPEEEERQRRAAIASRMAKLGGARMGMAPPAMFGARPSPPAIAKKPEPAPSPVPVAKPKDENEAAVEGVTSLPLSESLESAAAVAATPGPETAEAGADSDLSTSTGSHSRSPPPSMPAPSVPRRTAPPRRKPPKSPVPPTSEVEVVKTTQEQVRDEPETQTEATTLGLETTVVQVKQEQDVLGDVEPLTKEERRKVEVPPIEEVETVQSWEREKAGEEVGDDAGEHAQDVTEIVEEPESQEQEREQEQDKEGARRKRIAERLSKMGGVNPLFAPPAPPRRTSTDEAATSPRPSISDPVRRSSVDSVSSVRSGGPAKRTSLSSAAGILGARRTSVDSAKDAQFEQPSATEDTGVVGIPEQDEREEVVDENVTVPEQAKEVTGADKAKLGEDRPDSMANLASTYRNQARWDETEKLEGGNDTLATSMILERSPSPEEYDPFRPSVLDRSTHPATVSGRPSEVEERRSSGFVVRPGRSNDERVPEAAYDQGTIKHEQDQGEENGNENILEETSRASPPPLPISPRTASFVPSSLGRRFRAKKQDESEDEDEDEPKPLPILHRASFSASSRPPLRKASDVDEGEGGRHNKIEEEWDIPLPPTRLPPPPSAHIEIPIGLPPPIDANQAQPSHGTIVEDEAVSDEEREHEVGPRQHQGPKQQQQEKQPVSGQSDTPLVIPPPPAERRMSKDYTTIYDRPLPHRMSVRQSQVQVQVPSPTTGTTTRYEREVMDDEEGDPIDPLVHDPKHTSIGTIGSGRGQAVSQDEEKQDVVDPSVADMEPARRRTIAERMAKLGGIKFGAAPPIPEARLPSVSSEHTSETEGYDWEGKEKVEGGEEGEEERKEVDEEEEERARKERIAAKLATMGGMRIGMMPPMMGIPPRPPQRPAPPPALAQASIKEEVAPVPPSPTTTTRGAPTRPPPPPQPQDVEWERESTSASEDGVKVEMEESDMEEVNYEDARMDDEYEGEMVASPPPPTRPPVPSTASIRRLSGGITTPGVVPRGRKSSSGSTTTMTAPTSSHRARGQSDYVMVEEPQSIVKEEEAPPPPPSRALQRRSTREAPSHPPPPPPPSATQTMSDSISSQWELPAIPSGSFGLGGPDLSLSWTETDDTALARSTLASSQNPPAHTPPSPPVTVSPTATSASAPAVPSASPTTQHQRLSSEELTAIWGRVGVQICEIAVALYEKSRRTLVGDGTYAGFVHAVLNEVPNAVRPAYTVSSSAPVVPERWGYLVYAQSGPAVQRRLSDIMPGDIIELIDARLKGHKGLQAYSQHVGSAGEALVGVVGEVEQKKIKVRVLQANQHVGQQTVESVSYRLEDLKSGMVKVYRVLETQ
ncbi:hypothetical protein AX15_005882 [Amanita polypyramis BW_CC]|nr:hypothetical protein AX15_005882 [Amanita polypyramis BW_CC]